MLLLVITSSIAVAAIVVSWKVTEEIESLGASLIAGLCLLLSICFAPLLLKTLIFLFLLLNNYPHTLFSLKEEP